MMCTAFSRFTMSMSEASVVLLPEPVGPVTSTRPRGSSANARTVSGTPRLSNGTISYGMARMTAPTLSRWRKTLTRKRLWPGSEYEQSSSSSFSNFSRCFCVRIA